MGRDLKLTAELADNVTKKIDGLTNKLTAFGAKTVTETQKNGIRVNAVQDRMAKETLRIQRQAAQAEASLVLDKFERRLAVERVKHRQILDGLKENHTAQEAELRRFNAVQKRIQMDQGNFSNTPFQKMLENFNKLNNTLGKVGPTMTTVAGSAGMAGSAMMGFGGALSSLAMGSLGAVILGVTALNGAMQMTIASAERAADLKANQARTIRNPEQLAAAIKSLEAYRSAKARVSSGDFDLAAETGASSKAMTEMAKAAREFKAIMGEDAETTIWSPSALKGQAKALATTSDTAKKALKDAKAAQEERWEWEREVQASNISNQEKAAAYARRKAEEKAKLQSDIIRTEEGYKQKAIKDAKGKAELEGKSKLALKGAQAGNDEMAKLKVKHEQEIEEANKAGLTLKTVEARHLLERDALKEELHKKDIDRSRRETEAKLGATATFFGGFAALTGQANMKERSARLRWKATAIAEATASTFVGANKALASAPPPFNYIAMAGVIAAGLANVNQIKDQKFARGTDYAPGGMALVGEQGPEMVYLPKGSQVKTAPETNRMMGGTTINAPIHISLSGTATYADANRVAETVGRRLKELKSTDRDASYQGYRA